jgi:hypothetical protein
MAEPSLQQIQQTQVTIPDYAKPYVEELLGNAQGLTDINQKPVHAVHAGSSSAVHTFATAVV